MFGKFSRTWGGGFCFWRRFTDVIISTLSNIGLLGWLDQSKHRLPFLRTFPELLNLLWTFPPCLLWLWFFFLLNLTVTGRMSVLVRGNQQWKECWRVWASHWRSCTTPTRRPLGGLSWPWSAWRVSIWFPTLCSRHEEGSWCQEMMMMDNMTLGSSNSPAGSSWKKYSWWYRSWFWWRPDSLKVEEVMPQWNETNYILVLQYSKFILMDLFHQNLSIFGLIDFLI